MTVLSKTTLHYLNQLPGSIGIKSKESVYLAGNDYFAAIVGLKHKEDIIGRTDYHLNMRDNLAKEYISQDQYIFETAQTLHSLQFRRCADGLFHLFYSVKKPFYDENKAMIGIVGHGTHLDEHFLNLLAPVFRRDAQGRLVEQNILIKDAFSLKGCDITRREMEVFFYIMRGKTVKEVASCLHVSPRTVETHVNHLKAKTQCLTKSQLIEFGINAGFYNIFPRHFASEYLPFE